MATVTFDEVTKGFGRVRALDGLSFTIREGTILGLLGPNGSGKSTLLKLVAGLYRPDSGRVTIDGEEPTVKTKAKVAYLPEIDYLYGWMSVRQILDYVSAFYTDWDAQRAREFLDFMGLDPGARVSRLSKGMRARLKIVVAMSRSAPVVLLDEVVEGPEAVPPGMQLRVDVRLGVPDGVELAVRHAGDVTLELEQVRARIGRVGGDLGLRGGYGEVDVAQVAGNVKADYTAGILRAQGITRAADLAMRMGEMEVVLEGQGGWNVEVRGAMAEIETDLALDRQGTELRSRLAGVVGDGAHELKIDVTQGKLRLVRR